MCEGFLLSKLCWCYNRSVLFNFKLMKYNIEKSIEINADMDKVKGLVADFGTWNSWSPWTIAEPDCEVKVTGSAGTVGHEMFWDGEIIGSGTHTIREMSDGRIDFDLEFLSPYKSKAQTYFMFEKNGGSTKVTWGMDGSMPFFLFFMIPMMKQWIGMDYERGLKMMKAIAEKGKVNAKTKNEGIKDVEGFGYVGLERTCSMAEIKDVMPEDFGKLMKVLQENGKNAKHWLSVYSKMNMKNGQMTYIAAMSDEDLEGVELGSEFKIGKIKGGKMLEIKHEGSYDFLGNAWSMGMMIVRAKKMKQNAAPFEYYWNNPDGTEESELKTSVYFPVKG